MSRRRFLVDINQDRFLRHQQGKTIAEIAEEDEVTEERVKFSIQDHRIKRELGTLPEVNLSQGDVIASLSALEKKSLEKALTATKVITDETGHRIRVEDHEVQLAASQAITEKLSSIQPRGGKGTLVQVNATSYSGSAAGLPAGSGVRSFEDLIRRPLPEGERPALTEGEANVIEAPAERQLAQRPD